MTRKALTDRFADQVDRLIRAAELHVLQTELRGALLSDSDRQELREAIAKVRGELIAGVLADVNQGPAVDGTEGRNR